MKIFQIVNGFCHWQTKYKSISETVGKYPPSVLFVEAPDYVFEGWGYDETQEGEARFIKPAPPEGWLYDDETGTFYPAEALPGIQEQKYNQLTVQYIRNKYSIDEENKVVREYLAYPADTAKQEAFTAYNTYVESCKVQAYQEIYGNAE